MTTLKLGDKTYDVIDEGAVVQKRPARELTFENLGKLCANHHDLDLTLLALLEVNDLRAAYDALRAECKEMKRERDEWQSHAQTNAEAVVALQAKLAAIEFILNEKLEKKNE